MSKSHCQTYEILFAIRAKIDIPGLFRKPLVMMTYGISQAAAYGELLSVQYQEYISLCNEIVTHN